MPPFRWPRANHTSPPQPTAAEESRSAEPPVQPPPEVHPLNPHSRTDIPFGLPGDRRQALQQIGRTATGPEEQRRGQDFDAPHTRGDVAGSLGPGVTDTGSPLDQVGLLLDFAARTALTASTRWNRGWPQGGVTPAPPYPRYPRQISGSQLGTPGRQQLVVRSINDLPSNLEVLGKPRTPGRRRSSGILRLGVGLAAVGATWYTYTWWNHRAAPQVTAENLFIPEGAAIKTDGTWESLKDKPILTFGATTSAKTQWNFTSPADPTKMNGLTDKPEENLFRTSVPWEGVVVINVPYSNDPAKSAVTLSKDSIATIDYSKVSVSIKPNPTQAVENTDKPPFFDRIDCKKDDSTNPYDTCITNVYNLFLGKGALAKEFVPPNLSIPTAPKEIAAQSVIKYIKEKYQTNQIHMINEAIAAGLQDAYGGDPSKLLVDAVRTAIKNAYGLNNPNKVFSVIEKNIDAITKQGPAAVSGYLKTTGTDTRTVQLVYKTPGSDQPNPVTIISINKPSQ